MLNRSEFKVQLVINTKKLHALMFTLKKLDARILDLEPIGDSPTDKRIKKLTKMKSGKPKGKIPAKKIQAKKSRFGEPGYKSIERLVNSGLTTIQQLRDAFVSEGRSAASVDSALQDAKQLKLVKVIPRTPGVETQVEAAS